MTLEGLKEYEAVRDFLYARMRWVKDHAPAAAASASAATTTAPDATELAATLRDVAHELRELRLALAARQAKETSPITRE
jgi:putative membrane protein